MTEDQEQVWQGIVTRCADKAHVTIGSDPRRDAVLAVDQELRRLRALVRASSGAMGKDGGAAPASGPGEQQPYTPCTLITPDGVVHGNKSVRTFKLMPVATAVAKLRAGRAAWVTPSDTEAVLAAFAGQV